MMGYIGSSPKFPRTAFSIQLLQLHHVFWKHCSVAMQPFSKAVDKFLDADSPLILAMDNGQQTESDFSVSA